MATTNCSGPRSAANPTYRTAGADATTSGQPAPLATYRLPPSIDGKVYELAYRLKAALALLDSSEHEFCHDDCFVGFTYLAPGIADDLYALADQLGNGEMRGAK